MIFDTRFSEKESMRYGVVDGTATIVKCEGDEMRVVIPASIDGFKVTKIEPLCFLGEVYEVYSVSGYVGGDRPSWFQ